MEMTAHRMSASLALSGDKRSYVYRPTGYQSRNLEIGSARGTLPDRWKTMTFGIVYWQPQTDLHVEAMTMERAFGVLNPSSVFVLPQGSQIRLAASRSSTVMMLL
mmetsp:Transcript_17127/g.29072  ORF Transcript_17127/g.29072 Transcript_17127/m.29072 type:complete len:105 (-) Transcript_17127:146-460(-)